MPDEQPNEFTADRPELQQDALEAIEQLTASEREAVWAILGQAEPPVDLVPLREASQTAKRPGEIVAAGQALLEHLAADDPETFTLEERIGQAYLRLAQEQSGSERQHSRRHGRYSARPENCWWRPAASWCRPRPSRLTGLTTTSGAA